VKIAIIAVQLVISMSSSFRSCILVSTLSANAANARLHNARAAVTVDVANAVRNADGFIVAVCASMMLEPAQEPLLLAEKSPGA